MRLKKLTAFVMALAIVLALVPAITVGAAFDIDDGLVLYYSFDNDSDQPYVITDDSGNGYTGAVLNTVHDGEGGPFGGEAVSNVLTIQGGLAHFPGGSSSGWRGQYNTGAAIKIPEDVRSDITGDYTVSMWVRVDNSYAYANQPQRFFDFGVSTTDSIFLRYTSSTGDMRFQDRGIGSGKDDSNSYISAYVNNEYLGNWHMLTVTYTAEDNTAAFYLDWYQCVSGSKFTRSLGDIPALTNDTYGMFLGRTQWYNENEKASNPDFCGWMDDVRIYNRALSEAEIDSLYSMSYHDEYLRSIVSGLNPSYTAFQGGPLYMPGNIEVGLDDGTRTYAEVIWDDITQEQLNTVGFFGVPGEVHIGDYNYGKIAYATITVISANSNLRDGLELYYSFENDGSQPSYITDDSYNGRAGQVLNNSDRWNRRQISVESAASGNVARFPGGTWMGNGAAIKIPEETRENITGDYTVSMWIKADSSYSFSGNLQRFFDFGVGQRDSIFVRYRVTDGDLRFQDRGLTSDGEDKRGYISTTDNSFADKWGLLTVTYNADDDAVVVYVNGNPVMSGDGFTRSLGDLSMLTNSTYGMYLGRTMWQDGENPDFCGWMDEVRIYSRAINEDEIQELYLTTCPEPMVQVAITHELEDGTVVEEPAPVTVAEGASYTYNAPIMIEYEGVIYRLSYVLSTLNIANVSRANNKIRAIYVIEEVTSQQEVLVEAYINTRPELPAFVNMSFNTGEIISVQTKWNDVPENGWDEPGEYIVNGMAIDYPVTATVTVYAIKSASVPEITYADMGARPSLPSAAAVTTTHGRTFNSAIEWDAMPEDKILSGESFDISGVLTDYPDVKVTTHVEFVTRSTKAVIAVADTYTTDGDRSTARYGSEDQLMISSTSGSGRAGYNRYAYLRFENPGVSEPIGARVKLFMNRIDNGAYTEYTIYAMNNSGWDEYELAWSWQNSYREGAEEIAKASYTPRGNPDYFGDWIEFDISDYINNYPDKEFYDFYISASTCAGYFSSREGDNPPVLEIDSMGKALTVRYMANGEEVRREAVAAPESGPFTFSPATAFVKDGRLYVSSGNVEIDDIADVYEVEVEVTETDFTVENPVINTYIDETPTMPSTVKISWDGGELDIPASFEEPQGYSDPGIEYVDGVAEGVKVKAEVKYYARWINSNGDTIDRASTIVVSFENYAGEAMAAPIETLVRVGTTYRITDDIIENHPELLMLEIPGYVRASEPVHELVITCARTEGLSGVLTGELNEGVDAPYDVTAIARLINLGEEAASALLIVADYSEEGISKLIEFERIELSANMTTAEEYSVTVPYDRETENIRAFLWDGLNLNPLDKAVNAVDLSIKDKYSPEVMELIPEYDTVKENVLRANDYRQSTWGPNQQVNNIHPSFWDTAAYHTGNMEVYYTFGGENYLEYSINWANGNGWMGNKNVDRFDEDSWTWGYNQEYDDRNNAVLFGDWQICFQTYLDLGLLAPDKSDLSSVEKVMGYQITKGEDAFWWWADALYMVPPVMTKMYLTTGNEGYLDKLYEYYRFAAELMYDGELGIPNEGEEYTTSAGSSKRSGSYLSDPDDYANLFFRDASYVYPLNPNPGHEKEKNFWARGNGWVFAGLAKILSDLPTDYEHRDFFTTIYSEMAKSIIDSQRIDDEGRGFWTQSMLQNYPVGNNGNTWGYETSGTAFFTYGLFWGLNSGMLDEDAYLEPALRAWKYLSEVALQEKGKVGYCQPIGSNATQATAAGTDQPFGYGAFLLAGSEVSRWVGGVSEDNAPYLMRKLWNGFAVSGDRYYRNGETGETGIYTDENGVLWFSEEALDVLMDMEVYEPELEPGTFMLVYSNSLETIPEDALTEVDGMKCVSAEFAAELAGKHMTDYDGVLVFSHKRDVFYDCDANSVEYLKSLLN